MEKLAQPVYLINPVAKPVTVLGVCPHIVLMFSHIMLTQPINDDDC